MIKRYKCIVEYNGSKYSGMQKQGDLPTIQNEIEIAVSKLLNIKTEIDYAGRTDAGVHATNQVIHFDVNNQRMSDEKRLLHGINFYLKNSDISIKKVENVKDNFNSRFDAIDREYKYFIYQDPSPSVFYRDRSLFMPYKINLNAMKEASSFFIGKHDFSTFRSSECQGKSPIRTINSINITTENSMIIIIISAKSFLHQMVRRIVGTMIIYGRGKMSPSEINTMLDAKNPTECKYIAPAHGLFLTNVRY
jgi:tRNA pseudouridine38-40 synthase